MFFVLTIADLRDVEQSVRVQLGGEAFTLIVQVIFDHECWTQTWWFVLFDSFATKPLFPFRSAPVCQSSNLPKANQLNEIDILK